MWLRPPEQPAPCAIMGQMRTRRDSGMAGSASRTEPPLIGITSELEAVRWRDWVREAAVLPAAYVRAVERARAVPVLLPPSARASVPVLVRRLDGPIVAGGGDVD